jgi:hypothetical protein
MIRKKIDFLGGVAKKTKKLQKHQLPLPLLQQLQHRLLVTKDHGICNIAELYIFKNPGFDRGFLLKTKDV